MSFIIKSRGRNRFFRPNEPLRHEAHKKPVTRRDFLAQGFLTGAATIVAPTMLASLLKSGRAAADPTTTLGTDITVLKRDVCAITGGAGKIPFICFDLAGGANIAGSNVLVGTQDQLDTLSTQGYSKLGLPADMVPNSSTGTFVDTTFGLAFHTDSAFLRGMLSTTSEATRANINGAVIPARSENDTGNNPHNPMYGIAKAGAKGELLTLIGTQNSESGGNSMAPASQIVPENRPTKIDRASDVRGLVDIGEVARILQPKDTVRSLEAMARLTKAKVGLGVGPADVQSEGKVTTKLDDEEDIDTRKRFLCGYVKTADTVNEFSDPRALDPAQDTDITAIFGPNFGGSGEFQRTASVMKLVVPGYAGAGTITMGGYDYHTGERGTGEERDFIAGQCIGACLEYAARRGKPLMVYVFSDGSVNSSGMTDDSVVGRGKGVWTGDDQQTAASFFLVYNPIGRPALMNATHQIGFFRRDGNVETASSPAANSVNLLVQTVLLNYMALHNEIGSFNGAFGNALGTGDALERLVALEPICNGTIQNPA